MDSFELPHTYFVPRLVDLPGLLKQKSHFLLGPRQTGKTALIRHSLPGVKTYNLLETNTFLALSQNPGRLKSELGPQDKLVVIDEIQRLPDLLNEVHYLIEERGIRFLLTGSSARKLRRGGVNLLGGRARMKHLHPLTFHELKDQFNLEKALAHGLLPPVYFSDNPQADLESYIGTYLQQEIAAESAIRQMPAFSRFLKVASLWNAKIVNFTNLASDAQVARTTVYEYFDIIKDTLLLHELPAWKKSLKRKPVSSSKFYFFDIGVVGGLQNRLHRPGTPEYGDAFETFLFHEILAYRDYEDGPPLSYWRSHAGFEVDFLLGDHTAIEAKAKNAVGLQDIRGLLALQEENVFKRHICVSLEERARTENGIQILPWKEFLEALWTHQYRT